MASALPRLELGRSGLLDGLHFVEFALPLCTCVRVWGHRCQRGLATGWGNRPFRSTGNLVVSCHDGMHCTSRSDRVGAHYEPGLRLTFRSTEDRDCRTLKPPPFIPGKVMTDAARDYSATLFLPQTDFPMRAGLPQKEPELLARWAKLGMYQRLRDAAKGRTKFVLHDGPPYANGNIHIGTALNKILKDVVTRSQQMLGYDTNYVPGWDCHGLPIEWKIEEEYRAKGKNKDAVPINEFRAECRAFATHWLGVQREEFKRLGVTGDWANPYTTMSFAAEAQIARELMKFAANGTLYRGSKPVMWSVVEKTALAEAEVEYEDYTSDTIWAKFPVTFSTANSSVEN